MAYETEIKNDFTVRHWLMQDAADFDAFIETQERLKPYDNARKELKKIKLPIAYPALITFQWFESDDRKDWIFCDYVYRSEFD